MTRSFYYILAIVFISILPFIFIFASPDLNHSSDGGVQIPRMAAYYKALTDFHIPVRWAGDLNYGYGLPLFNFIYHTPFLISSLFLYLGSGLVLAFKLVLMASFVFSGIGMFWFAHEFTRDYFKAFFITIFYQFAPFRLVEIFVRGAIGGTYAYTFFPFVLVGLTKIIKKPSLPAFLITSLASALLIISHNSLSVIFFSISALYLLVFSPNKKSLVYGNVALILGVALASFYWIPALAEHKYTYGDLFMKDLYRSHFPPLQNFFIPNVSNNESLRTAEISVQLGLFHTITLMLAAYLLIRKKALQIQTKKLFFFCFFLIAISFVFMQPISIPLWDRISFLRQFQFPWRLLAVTSFASSLLAMSIFWIVPIKKIWIYGIILILTVVSTFAYWRPPEGFDHVNEQDFWNYPLNTTYFGETDIIWSAGPANAFPKQRLEVVEGNATINQFVKKTQLHTAQIDALTDTRLVDHTQYFPGWRVYIDGKKTDIEFQDVNYRGLITFRLPQGSHHVRIEFGESPIRWIANAISLITLFALFVRVVTYWTRRTKL